jgi:predicted DNA-binding protein YlxM (UPF0122 family)
LVCSSASVLAADWGLDLEDTSFLQLLPKLRGIKQAMKKQNATIDLSKALTLRAKGLSYQDIANSMRTSKQAVHQRLKHFNALLDDDMLTAFEANQDKLVSGAMCKMLNNALDSDKLKSATTLQSVTSYGILFDKQRLMRGQSTSNVLTFDLTPAERDRMRQLESMIQDEVIDIKEESDNVSDNVQYVKSE